MSWIIFFTFLHPFHVSVTSIDYDEDRRAIEISMSIFADDLEKAIMKSGGPNIKVGTSKQDMEAAKYIEKYINSVFRIFIDTKEVGFDYLGFEYEDGAVWSYLQIEKVRKVNSLEVNNICLFEIFDDQENIIHTKVKGKKKSAILRASKNSSYFEY